MSKEEIVSKLTKIFHNIFDNDKIILFDEMTAKDVKGWDSLNHINLIVATEKDFKIKFTTKEIQKLPNVGTFIELIQAKIVR